MGRLSGSHLPGGLSIAVGWGVALAGSGLGCLSNSDDDSVVDSGIVARDAGMADSGVVDSGPPLDARPPSVDAGTFWQRLYGGNDGVVPGNPCAPTGDRCRTSDELYVCLDDARSTTGAYLSCRACETDEECRIEYPYLASQIACTSEGLCTYPNAPGCATGTLACRTARAGDFVCIEGNCTQCISAPECEAEYGPTWSCRFSSGQCVQDVDGGVGVDAGLDAGS